MKFTHFFRLTELYKDLVRVADRSLSAKVVIAFLGSFLFRFPFFAFQIAVANLQKKTIWENNFEIPCISDCRIYGELSEGFDRTGAFKWTYFPVWPNLISLFKNMIPFQMGGYGSAVVLSWIVSLGAGVLALFFFTNYFEASRKNNPTTLGFSKDAWLVCFLISIYPHSHFWLQGYSEPLFFSILIVGLIIILSGRYILTGFIIGLLATIRPQGIWLSPIWISFLGYKIYKREVAFREGIPSMILSIAGSLLLLLWFWKGTSDPFYYYRIQAQNGGYGRKFDLLQGLWNHRPRWDLATLYLYLNLIGSFKLIKKRDLTSQILGYFSIAFSEVPLFFGGFYSYTRFLSVSPAMFILLADHAKKSRLVEISIIVFFLTKFAIQIYKSGFHEWVG